MNEADKSKDRQIEELRARLAVLEQREQSFAQIEAKWQESERRFRTLLANLPGMAYRCHIDADWTMEFVSEGSLALTGYQPDEFIANSVLSYASLIHPDDQQQVQDDVQQALAEERPFLLSYRIHTRDGAEKWVWEQGRVVPHESAEEQMLEGFILDVTRQRQSDELRQALAAEKRLRKLKSRFVSMASHEFRNPLAGIYTTAGLLKGYGETMSPERRTEMVNRILNQVELLTALLDDTLAISRADMVGINPQVFAVDPQPLCQEIVQEIAQIDNGAHEFDVRFTGSFAGAEMDPKLLRQIISNLLSNAAKYSPVGRPIHVHLRSDGTTMTIRVADEGIGIPPEDQEHLFDLFHRASNVGTIAGTGLGLVIVKQSVEAQGGSIAYETALGSGTTFTITLPLVVPRSQGLVPPV